MRAKAAGVARAEPLARTSCIEPLVYICNMLNTINSPLFILGSFFSNSSLSHDHINHFENNIPYFIYTDNKSACTKKNKAYVIESVDINLTFWSMELFLVPYSGLRELEWEEVRKGVRISK